MPVVDIQLGDRSYPVHIGPDLLVDGNIWKPYLSTGNILIVSNDTVAPLYLDDLLITLGDIPSEALILPDGEKFKTMDQWSRVLDTLVEMRAGRDATLIALGGGVIGDLGGFAAACYMRGIRYIQVPTTLLAQVDASVGGKTAINHPAGKNLVGTFYQPALVIADTGTLSTLPGREYRAGLAEVVKYGALMDNDLFTWLESNIDSIAGQDPETVTTMVRRCVENKAQVVAADERESGRRALLNFGHSFGHGLEVLGAFEQLLHGEAVAIGMAIAARLSEQRGLCAPGTHQRITTLLAAFGLPTSVPEPFDASSLLEAMSLDKKNSSGTRRLILLESIGQARIDTGSSDEAIRQAIVDCNS
ncbi:MAG: 3-dehydroquinate synthase [Xanthomonadales bacterium]|nr:3-dehydroquinate synthase [Xanthomonadales bacterium]